MRKTVCLIGRPNTGKSSLFNCFLREKKAIIMDEPGVTRDRIYGIVSYKSKEFYLIDTGGLESGSSGYDDILVQVSFAIDEADLVLFVVDGKEGLTASDYQIRDLLLKSNKNVFVVVNKIDNEKRMDDVYAFYELGFEHVFACSVAHKLGINVLLDAITSDISVVSDDVRDVCRFCFIGRPNTGKSPLVNEERCIVSDVAGTTRDAIDTYFTYDHQSYVVVDTAGMRRKGRVYDNIERYSFLRSMRAISECDVCVLVLDATSSITEQDMRIAGMAIDSGKALVICVNKFDLVENSEKALKDFKMLIDCEFKFLSYASVIFTSAKTKKRLHLLMPAIINAYENYRQEISTSLLNDCIKSAVMLHEAPSYKGRRLKINFVSQSGVCPPKFTFYVNDKGLVHFSYARYLENKLRDNFDLSGTPILLQFKNKNDD